VKEFGKSVNILRLKVWTKVGGLLFGHPV